VIKSESLDSGKNNFGEFFKGIPIDTDAVNGI